MGPVPQRKFRSGTEPDGEISRGVWDMNFQREDYSPNLVVDMQPMLIAHDEEIPQLGLRYDPDWAVYKKMDECGALRIYTARIGDLLVGYQVFFIGYHPHRKESLEATQDVLYMDPECRQGLAAVKFIKWCDNEIAKENIRVVHHPIDYRHNFGAIFKRMGYHASYIVFSKKM